MLGAAAATCPWLGPRPDSCPSCPCLRSSPTAGCRGYYLTTNSTCAECGDGIAACADATGTPTACRRGWGLVDDACVTCACRPGGAGAEACMRFVVSMLLTRKDTSRPRHLFTILCPPPASPCAGDVDWCKNCDGGRPGPAVQGGGFGWRSAAGTRRRARMVTCIYPCARCCPLPPAPTGDASSCNECSTSKFEGAAGKYFNGSACLDCLQAGCRNCTGDGEKCVECIGGIAPDADGRCPTGSDPGCRAYDADGGCLFW